MKIYNNKRVNTPSNPHCCQFIDVVYPFVELSPTKNSVLIYISNKQRWYGGDVGENTSYINVFELNSSKIRETIQSVRRSMK